MEDQNAPVRKKWYQSTWAAILFLFLFFPLGLFLMWRYTSWNKFVKWGITAFFILVILIGSFTDSSKTASQSTTPTPVQKVTSHVTQIQEATQAPTKAIATSTKNIAPQFKDGTYEVGKNVKPGIYRTRKGSFGCYYERLAGFSGELGDIISNENTDYPAIVEIETGDKGFKSTRCGTWSSDLSQITKSKTKFDDGMYIVGTDIEPGTYKSVGRTGCYYARLAGFSGGLGDIISNENTDDSAIVTISANDKGFRSTRCGSWSKM